MNRGRVKSPSPAMMPAKTFSGRGKKSGYESVTATNSPDGASLPNVDQVP
jgi:hypothetical protein